MTDSTCVKWGSCVSDFFELNVSDREAFYRPICLLQYGLGACSLSKANKVLDYAVSSCYSKIFNVNPTKMSVFVWTF